MAVQYFVAKPAAMRAVQWTGANFTEVEDFVESSGNQVSDNGDGTLTVQSSLAGSWDIPQGAHVNYGGGIVDLTQYQEVVNDDVTYVVQ